MVITQSIAEKFSGISSFFHCFLTFCDIGYLFFDYLIARAVHHYDGSDFACFAVTTGKAASRSLGRYLIDSLDKIVAHESLDLIATYLADTSADTDCDSKFTPEGIAFLMAELI